MLPGAVRRLKGRHTRLDSCGRRCGTRRSDDGAPWRGVPRLDPVRLRRAVWPVIVVLVPMLVVSWALDVAQDPQSSAESTPSF